MAGTKEQGSFKEIVSPFLRSKIEDLKNNYGTNSKEYFAIASQYLKSDKENYSSNIERKRHYESNVEINYEGLPLIGVERLYKPTILIEPTTVCAAHCRWCLRGQYPIQTMKKDEIIRATKYMSSKENKEELFEVLITGGDPLMSLPLLKFTLEQIEKNAPNISIIRIGTRVPFQDPERINDSMLELFSNFKKFRFEAGINVNHPIEFWEESIKSIKKLQSVGFKIYNQNPLLKGVNDDFNTLVELYSKLRKNDVEAHYLFHAIPMVGTNHHRTSLKTGYDLTSKLSSCGLFSGRSKPKYAVLSDIGKIVIYEDTIVKKRTEDNSLLLKSGFNYDERLKWNPSWVKPQSVEIAKDGTMYTWYLDGDDKK
jgi:lysine 2,3-aminomutase